MVRSIYPLSTKALQIPRHPKKEIPDAACCDAMKEDAAGI